MPAGLPAVVAVAGRGSDGAWLFFNSADEEVSAQGFDGQGATVGSPIVVATGIDVSTFVTVREVGRVLLEWRNHQPQENDGRFIDDLGELTPPTSLALPEIIVGPALLRVFGSTYFAGQGFQNGAEWVVARLVDGVAVETTTSLRFDAGGSEDFTVFPTSGSLAIAWTVLDPNASSFAILQMVEVSLSPLAPGPNLQLGTLQNQRLVAGLSDGTSLQLVTNETVVDNTARSFIYDVTDGSLGAPTTLTSGYAVGVVPFANTSSEHLRAAITREESRQDGLRQSWRLIDPVTHQFQFGDGFPGEVGDGLFAAAGANQQTTITMVHYSCL
jgi:hypothetical protein